MTIGTGGPRDRDQGGGGRESPYEIPERRPTEEPTRKSPDGSTPPRGVGDGEED